MQRESGQLPLFPISNRNLNLKSAHIVVSIVCLTHVMSSNFGHKYPTTVIIHTIAPNTPWKHLLTI